MPRVKISPAKKDQKMLDVEIAHLRDLDVSELRARWRTVFRRRPQARLPRDMFALPLKADFYIGMNEAGRRVNLPAARATRYYGTDIWFADPHSTVVIAGVSDHDPSCTPDQHHHSNIHPQLGLRPDVTTEH